MAWTYVDPSNSTKDAVRFAIGDTDTKDQQLTDEEINYLLTKHNDSVALASIEACTALIAKYSREADTRLGPRSIAASQRAKAYMSLRDQLRAEQGIAQGGMAGPQAISLGAASFTVGMHDNNQR